MINEREAHHLVVRYRHRDLLLHTKHVVSNKGHTLEQAIERFDMTNSILYCDKQATKRHQMERLLGE